MSTALLHLLGESMTMDRAEHLAAGLLPGATKRRVRVLARHLMFAAVEPQAMTNALRMLPSRKRAPSKDGRPVEPSMREYAQLPGVNWSRLKHILKSALLYLYRSENPQADSPFFAIGRATHALALDPASFISDFAIWGSLPEHWTGTKLREGKLRPRSGKLWDAFEAEHPGLTILREPDLQEVKGIANATRTHPLVAPYMVGAEFERILQWVDPVTGIACKGRLDWLQRPGLIDYKTAQGGGAEGRVFGNAALRYGYLGQLAFYAMGVEQALGWKPERWVIVVVEKSAPYEVTVFEVPDEARYLGECLVRESLDRLAECQKTNHWPGRYTDEQQLQLPAWAWQDDEDPSDWGITINGGK